MIKPLLYIIYGPTGVGKTDFALSLAQHVPIEIINIDMGQFYTPLSIGTAKPDWRKSDVTHHMFDIIDHPRHYTVIEYKSELANLIKNIIQRGSIPVIVGGSSFYVYSLFFTTPLLQDHNAIYNQPPMHAMQNSSWEFLHSVDPIRASSIDKNDKYRIERALHIWHGTGIVPSSCSILYDPPSIDFVLTYITRPRQELYTRINNRVDQMLQNGWIEEVRNLSYSQEWCHFIHKKKVIGYNELLEMVQKEDKKHDISSIIDIIKQRTRNYAKRQHTFWKKIKNGIHNKAVQHGTTVGCLEEVMMANKADEDNYRKKVVHYLKTKITI